MESSIKLRITVVLLIILCTLKNFNGVLIEREVGSHNDELNRPTTSHGDEDSSVTNHENGQNEVRVEKEDQRLSKPNEGGQEESHKNTDPMEEYHDKANLTAYLHNISKEATDELVTIWWDQRIYIDGVEEEKNVIYQTYKVELKRISYIIERAYELIEKQVKIIADLKWDLKDENQPQPYHVEIIDQLAQHWKNIERYFRENRLKGVDTSVRRINKLTKKAQDELSRRYNKLEKLMAEMKRLQLLGSGIFL